MPWNVLKALCEFRIYHFNLLFLFPLIFSLFCILFSYLNILVANEKHRKFKPDMSFLLLLLLFWIESQTRKKVEYAFSFALTILTTSDGGKMQFLCSNILFTSWTPCYIFWSNLRIIFTAFIRATTKRLVKLFFFNNKTTERRGDEALLLLELKGGRIPKSGGRKTKQKIKKLKRISKACEILSVRCHRKQWTVLRR